MQTAITWFEIPAVEFDRAVAFYEHIFGVTMHREVFGGLPNGMFPYTRGEGTGGAIVQGPQYKPSNEGVLLYLNAGDQLDAILARVVPAGGKIVMPKTDIGAPGHIAIIVDTEGNTVGLNQG
jgi:predicted enzyme related to lactoylglutathione lyase